MENFILEFINPVDQVVQLPRDSLFLNLPRHRICFNRSYISRFPAAVNRNLPRSLGLQFVNVFFSLAQSVWGLLSLRVLNL